MNTEQKIAEIINRNEISVAVHTIRLIIEAVANSNISVDEAIETMIENSPSEIV